MAVLAGGKVIGQLRACPMPARIGLVLVLAGVLLAPQAMSLPHAVVLLGTALLAISLLRVELPQAGHAGQASRLGQASHAGQEKLGDRDAGAADGIEQRLETLRDVVWELRESEARYRDLLDTQEQIIVRFGSEGRLTFVNRAFCRLFGVAPADVLGRAWQPQVLAEELEAADAAPSWATLGGEPRRRYVQLVETIEGARWLAFEEHRVPGQGTARDEIGREDAARFETGGGPAGEVQLVATDVTDARQAAAELASARDQALAADRAKSRFLAAMSHEIRTPMNGIMGMASLLGDTDLGAEQQTYLEAIDQSARTLLLLIDEILDFSKIEAGKLVLGAEPFALDACVQGAVELLAPAAYEKGLELAWTLPPSLPSSFVGDAARVRQIMLNLISNAVKYTDRGGVLVTIEHSAGKDAAGERAEGGGGAHQLSIRVKDTGIGLSGEAMARLFSEFNQGDVENALRRGGTGLGLAISRRLARAMGGDITVESEPGRGAAFTATMVLAVAEGARPVLEVGTGAVAAGSVLLAFDNRIERRALARSLAAIGLDVIEAEETLEPVNHQAEARALPTVGYVVCDAQADPQEASEVLARARAAAGGREVKGVLLIDSVTRPSLEQFRAAGFTSYLVRPVRPRALLARFGLVPLLAAIDERAVAPSVSSAPEEVALAGRRVLLAEDNAVNALLARRMLEKSGCTVVHALDGVMAVAEARRSLENGQARFDLILMDVHMPRLDGLAATAEIRAVAAQMGRSADVPPIVALTANAFAEDRARCLAAGLDDYLAKPFHKNELCELMARWDRRPGVAA